MSFIYGMANSTRAQRHRDVRRRERPPALFAAAIFLTLVGLRVQGRARCRSTSGRPTPTRASPTPVTAFLSVASKAGGFVALLTIVTVRLLPVRRLVAADPLGARGRVDDAREPRRAPPDEHRSACWRTRRSRRAGSSSCRFAVAGDVQGDSAWEAVVIYLLIYAAMNLGAFAVGDRRRPRARGRRRSRRSRASGARDPVLAVMLSIFLLSLAGVPPLAGWFAKFVMFRAVFDAGTHRRGRARRDRRGELGDRVLLLRGRPSTDVVPRARRGARSTHRPHRRPLALERGAVPHHGCVVLVDRRVPAVLRPPRGARLHARADATVRRLASDASGSVGERADHVRRVPGARALRRRRRLLRRSGGGAGRPGATSSPAPRSARCSVRSWRVQLDEAWARLGHPDPFVVVEAGAGRGRLASDVLRAEPECAPALRYVLVERSAALRAAQRDLLTLEPADEVARPVVPRGGDDPDESPRPVAGMGPIVTSLAELPAVTVVGVVIANELLDNLPCPDRRAVGRRLVGGARRRSTDDAARRGRRRGRARLAAVRPTSRPRAEVPDGARLPVPDGDGGVAARRRARRCTAGRCCSSTTPSPRRSSSRAARSSGCARTAGHERGGVAARRSGHAGHHVRRAASSTCALAAGAPASRSRGPHASASGSPASGIDELVAEGASRLASARARRRPRGDRGAQPRAEAAALTDPPASARIGSCSLSAAWTRFASARRRSLA